MSAEVEFGQWLYVALNALREFEVRMQPAQPDAVSRSSDFLVDATINGKKTCLGIDVRANGFPRDMRAYVHRLAERRATGSAPETWCHPVVAAPVITETSRKYLRSEGISYLDGSGSFYLNLPDSMILIDREPRLESLPRKTGLFRRSSSQVLHALLVAPYRTWHINELANRSETSPSTAHGVVTELERIGWMSRHGSGPNSQRTLTEPGELLDAWASEHSFSAYHFRRLHMWAPSPNLVRRTVTQALEGASIPSALTLSSGAQMVSPNLTQDQVTYVIVPERPDVLETMRTAGAKAVDDGGNIALLETSARTPLLFTQQIDGESVASNIQLYLDLWAWPRRGREQATHLREERIGF